MVKFIVSLWYWLGQDMVVTQLTSFCFSLEDFEINTYTAGERAIGFNKSFQSYPSDRYSM
jgi:hypothetical protein